MNFSSIHFLFFFLPITFIAYHLFAKWKWRNLVLFTSSLVLFGWADLSNLHLLLISVILNFVFGLIIGKFSESGEKKSARPYMWVAVIVNILLLWFYKYLGLSIEAIERIFQTQLDFQINTFPLGISYFTFTGLSYILDVYHGIEKAEQNLLHYATYMVMFPKIIQGPITRYGQVRNELRASKIVFSDTLDGVRRFIVGLAKKILIADSLAISADKVFLSNPETLGAGVAWYGLVSFALQIYFDFSGYTDMAIGLGKVFGFNLPENFNYPYISSSVTDFWRRWHMSLTGWFRTYLFLPLEFARKREKILRQQSNILIIFALTGLWHGSSWNFLIWGIYFGLLLALEASGLGKRVKKLPRVLQHVYALVFIALGWVLFRLTDIKEWAGFFKSLFGGNGWAGTETLRSLNILYYWPILLLACLLSTPFIKKMLDKINAKSYIVGIVMDVLLIVLLVITISYLLSSGYRSFLYEQF